MGLTRASLMKQQLVGKARFFEAGADQDVLRIYTSEDVFPLLAAFLKSSHLQDRLIDRYFHYTHSFFFRVWPHMFHENIISHTVRQSIDFKPLRWEPLKDLHFHLLRLGWFQEWKHTKTQVLNPKTKPLDPLKRESHLYIHQTILGFPPCWFSDVWCVCVCVRVIGVL